MADKVKLKFLLFFDCKEETMINRMAQRAKTSGRNDDNPETMKKRIETFVKETTIVVDSFKKNNKAQVINAERSVEEIFAEVDKLFAKKKKEIKIQKPNIVFVMGGPGSGKGTQCAKLIEKHKEIHHISTGDLLREELKSGSSEAKQLDALMKEGKMVPSEMVVDLILKALKFKNKGNDTFLLDGFPRNQENVDV